MKDAGQTREMLLMRIEELEILNRELLTEKENEVRLKYSWTGNLGHWYWNIKTNTVTINPLKVTALGYDESEIPEQITYQFFTSMLHPDDYQPTMDAMMNHLYGRSPVYEVEYRIKGKDGEYKWYYDRGRITQYDGDGKPLFLAGIVFDITEKKKLQMDLEQQNKILAERSSIDGLTQISNRRSLIEFLETETEEANRSNKPLSVAIFDIDNFKRVNDIKGHVVGDQVLVEVARIIRKNTRVNDLAGRYGGEEFMVVFANADLAIAANISERIRQAIAHNQFVDGLQITISGGVKQYIGESLTEFIHAADVNLYEAKKRGKNRIIQT